jgi:dTDP-4-amino-4,6-dideoxygalactose transaminase
VIPVAKPVLPKLDQVAKYLDLMDKSGTYSNFGPLVKILESRYAERFGVSQDRVVSMTNATLAIEGCLSILDRSEWICPDYTFSATAHAILNAGKSMTLVDVKDSDWQINLSELQTTSLEMGIVPVMPFGAPVDILQYTKWNSVVIDAAASLGSTIDNVLSMREEHFVVYSLHATKVLGSGEGAIVLCGSSDTAAELRSWSNFGFAGFRFANARGTNAKMSEISAAYGLASLDNIDKESYEWSKALDTKNELLQNIGMTNHSDFYPGFRPYWIFDTRLSNATQVSHHLKNEGIDSRLWWSRPISEMPGFRNRFSSLNKCIVAENLSNRLIGLPMWRGISKETLIQIVRTLEKTIS